MLSMSFQEPSMWRHFFFWMGIKIVLDYNFYIILLPQEITGLYMLVYLMAQYCSKSKIQKSKTRVLILLLEKQKKI